MSTWELIKYPGVATVIYIYGHVMILAYAYTSSQSSHLFSPRTSWRRVVSSTFNYTKVKFGGFGFSNFQISLFIALAGFSQAMWTLVAFTPLQHRFGTGAILRWCAIAWPISFAIFPLCNTFLRKEWKIAFWITAPLANAVGSGVSMAFSKLPSYLISLANSCCSWCTTCFKWYCPFTRNSWYTQWYCTCGWSWSSSYCSSLVC